MPAPGNASMDMKRCAYCHKLVRIDAEVCDRCGHSFAPRKRRASSQDNSTRVRSIPPASPHRAGHYSGFHPEDQPYYSAMMSAQRPAVRKSDPRVLAAKTQEQENLLLSADTIPMPDVDEPPMLPVTPLPTLPEEQPPYQPRPRSDYWLKRAIPIVLTISCLLLLFSGSLLAYISINKKPVVPPQLKARLTANPQVLRINDAFTLTGSDFAAND